MIRKEKKLFSQTQSVYSEYRREFMLFRAHKLFHISDVLGQKYTG